MRVGSILFNNLSLQGFNVVGPLILGFSYSQVPLNPLPQAQNYLATASAERFVSTKTPPASADTVSGAGVWGAPSRDPLLCTTNHVGTCLRSGSRAGRQHSL